MDKQESVLSADWKGDSDRQTAIVIGATGGIGRALALALAEQRRALCLVGRNADTLAAIVTSVQEKASQVISYQADFTDDDDVRKLAGNLQRDLVSVDLLIHCAGVISIAALKDAPIEDLDWQYRVNVRAPYQLTQALLPMMQSGQIVFVNSLVGLNAKGGSSQYSMAKHALRALADSLRQEVKPDGIRVLSVFLGRTATPMQAAVHRMEARSYATNVLIEPGDVARMILTALSLSRTAEVTDITIRHSIKSAS
jgi:short-subunit dehydrogenase